MLTARKIIEALSHLSEEEKDVPFYINFAEYSSQIGRNLEETIGDERIAQIQLYLQPNSFFVSAYLYVEAEGNKDYYIDRGDETIPAKEFGSILFRAQKAAKKLWKK